MPRNNKNKKSVWIFSAASFLNDLGSDMVFPLWPIFVTSILGAPLSVLGLIDGLGEALVSISQALSGYWSDKLKKKKVFIWLGYLFSGISRFGYGIASSWQVLVPLKSLDRLGKIRGAPRDALVANAVNKKKRGQAFGVLRTADNLGAVCGVILSIILIRFIGIRTIFLLAAIPSFLAMILVIFLIKEKKTDKIFKGLKIKNMSGNLKLFIFVSGIFSLGLFSYSFLLLAAENFGFTIYTLPILYLIISVVATLSSLPFGRVADKLSRKSVLYIGYLMWALALILFIVFHTYWAVIIAFVAYGLHLGAVDPVQRAFVSELAPTGYRASTLGFFKMIVGIMALPASLVAGILWDNVNIYTPFYFALLLTGIAFLLLFFVKEKKNI